MNPKKYIWGEESHDTQEQVEKAIADHCAEHLCNGDCGSVQVDGRSHNIEIEARLCDMPTVGERLTLNFSTKGSRRLLKNNLDSARTHGTNPKLELYYTDGGDIALSCSTEEREEFEASNPFTIDADTLSPREFAALAAWLERNAGLKLYDIRAT